MSAIPVRSYALDTRLPFTRADARAAGLKEDTLRSGRYQRLFYDLYVSAEVPITPRLRAQAALHVAGPTAYVSHQTAAILWDLPVPNDASIHLSVSNRSDRCVRQGVRSHLAHPRAATASRFGIRVATPVQTFLDLAASAIPLVDLVVLGDMILKAGHSTRLGLIAATDEWTGKGRSLAKRAALLVRDQVDSPMETRVRLLLIFAGLPEPQINKIIRAGDGTWRLRFDLCYENCKIIIEYDGRQHADDPIQWERDIYRREELERMGYRLIIITARGVYQQPLRTLERVRDALLDRQAPGVRRRLDQGWRRHFVAL